MTERPIRLFGDPVLKSRCTPVSFPADRALRELVGDLIDSVRIVGRAGVAAPQIGVPLRAFSYSVDGRVGYVLNPQPLELEGEAEPVGEACLSLPDLAFPTPRHRWARCIGQNLEGELVTLEGEGLIAQMLQHECDHLDGRVYLERLEGETRRRALKSLRGTKWFLR